MTAIVVVGSSQRASAWTAALSAAPAVTSVRQISPEHSEIRRAVSESPGALLAIVPSGGVGQALAAFASGLGSEGLVCAPPGKILPRGFFRAPDFEAVPGVGWLAKYLRGAVRLVVELRGSADGFCEDLSDAVHVGVCVVARLCPDAQVRSVSLQSESRALVEFQSATVSDVTLIATSDGALLRVSAQSDRTTVRLHVDEHQEERTLHADGQRRARRISLPPATARALAPLGRASNGPALPAASEQVEAQLSRLPPPPSAFRYMRMQTPRNADAQAALWRTSGTLADASAVKQLQDPAGTSHLELLAFGSGLKPAVILALSAAEAATLAQRFDHTRTLPAARGVLWLAAESDDLVSELEALRCAPEIQTRI